MADPDCSDATTAEQQLTAALSLLAHDLRNATATLVTGLSLLKGADATESVEIADDLRGPAGFVTMMTDIVVEAARSIGCDDAHDSVAVADLAVRAARRAARGGVTFNVEPQLGDSDTCVMVTPGTAERCLCAAAVSIAGTDVVIELVGPATIALRDVSAGPLIQHRFAQAARLLTGVLCAGAGVTCRYDDEGTSAMVQLTFVAATKHA